MPQSTLRLIKHPWFWIAVELLIVLVAGIYVYAPALHGLWLWDDSAEITNNVFLHDLSGLGKIWFSTAELDYFPLKSTVQWVSWQLVGNNETYYHGLNIVTHLVSCVLIWRLLHVLGLRLSWLGGLLFAIHPFALESVAWISELKNTLSLIPLILALLVFISFEANPTQRRKDYYISLLLFIAAMLCKSSVVMFPVILLLYLWYRRGKFGSAEIKLSIPFISVSIILGLVTLWFQSNRALAGMHLPEQGILIRLHTALQASIFYISKVVFPVGLIPMYPHLPHWGSWQVSILPGIITLIFLILIATKQRFTSRGLLFGVLSFLLNLIPVLGFIPMSFFKISEVADHLGYLALVSAVCLAVAGLDYLYYLIKDRYVVTWVGLVALVGLILTLIQASHTHAAIFKSSETYWRYTLDENPKAHGAAYNLGWYYTSQPDGLSLAEAYYKKALDIKPDFFEAEENYAGVLALMPGRNEDSLVHFKKAVALGPDHPEVHNNYGATLLDIKGHLPDAVMQIQEAIRLNPDYADAHDNLGIALASLPGRMHEALHEYEMAIRLDPTNAKAQGNYANALARVPGRMSDALAQYEVALKVKPVLAETYYNYANKLISIPGRLQEGITHYLDAIKIKPDFAEAHNNVALNLQTLLGRKDEALMHFAEAVRIKPSYAEAHYNYAELLCQDPDKKEDAIKHYKIAVLLRPDHYELYYKIAILYANLGQTQKALEELSLLLKIDPSSSQARDLYERIRTAKR